MKWARTALKPAGKLYVLTMTPFIAALKEQLAPVYTSNRKANHVYPGFIADIHAYKSSDSQTPKPAKPITFFCSDELQSVFTTYGFTIQKTYYLQVPTIETQEWSVTDEYNSEMLAITGINNKKALDN